MADQEGRIAVVTGGGRGLGRGVALGLAGAGATVIAVARDTDQLAETERLAADLPGAVRGSDRTNTAPRSLPSLVTVSEPCICVAAIAEP